MNEYEDGKIEMNSYFFEHLLKCLKKQKGLQKQSPVVKAEWQAVIDMTYEQAVEMLNTNKTDNDKEAVKEGLSVHNFLTEQYWENVTSKSTEDTT